MTRQLLAAAALLSFAALPVRATAANLVTNGGFETADLSGWTVTGDANTFAALSGFDAYLPHSGNYYAALGDGTGTGSLSQLLTTVAGQTYTLSYYLTSRGDNPSSFSVQWNGVTIAGSALVNPDSGASMTLYSFLVTGTGSDTLKFLETDVPGFMGLDDVSLTPTAVPEAASWVMMFLGFGTIGAALRRKRSKTAAQLA